MDEFEAQATRLLRARLEWQAARLAAVIDHLETAVYGNLHSPHPAAWSGPARDLYLASVAHLRHELDAAIRSMRDAHRSSVKAAAVLERRVG